MFSYLATEIQGGNCFVMLKHLAVDIAPCSNVFFWLKKKKMHAHCKEIGTFRGMKNEM